MLQPNTKTERMDCTAFFFLAMVLWFQFCAEPSRVIIFKTNWNKGDVFEKAKPEVRYGRLFSRFTNFATKASKIRNHQSNTLPCLMKPSARGIRRRPLIFSSVGRGCSTSYTPNLSFLFHVLIVIPIGR